MPAVPVGPVVRPVVHSAVPADGFVALFDPLDVPFGRFGCKFGLVEKVDDYFGLADGDFVVVDDNSVVLVDLAGRPDHPDYMTVRADRLDGLFDQVDHFASSANDFVRVDLVGEVVVLVAVLAALVV